MFLHNFSTWWHVCNGTRFALRVRPSLTVLWSDVSEAGLPHGSVISVPQTPAQFDLGFSWLLWVFRTVAVRCTGWRSLHSSLCGFLVWFVFNFLVLAIDSIFVSKRLNLYFPMVKLRFLTDTLRNKSVPIVIICIFRQSQGVSVVTKHWPSENFTFPKISFTIYYKYVVVFQ